MELLCEQADLGSLSIGDIQRALKTEFPIWDSIRYKFEEGPDGRFFNRVLRNHIEKRKNYVKSRISNLNSPHKASHMGAHMENENVNENVNKNIKNKLFIIPTVPEVKSYCRERKNTVDAERFVDFYASKGWMVGKNKMKDWKAAVRTWEKSSPPRQERPHEQGPPEYPPVPEKEQEKLRNLISETAKSIKDS